MLRWERGIRGKGRSVGGAALTVLLGVTLANAQPVAADGASALVQDFAVATVGDLPPFFLEKTTACFQEAVDSLTPADREVLGAAADFIAGVNAVAAATPEIAAGFFEALDGCGGTLTAGEIMWEWLEAEQAGVPDDERLATGACLLVAVDRLPFPAKRGITRFQYGDFADAISAMLFERADLAGTIVADMAACGIILPE